MKEVIVKLTSDRIKIKGGEYVQDLVRCKDCNKHGTMHHPQTDRKGSGRLNITAMDGMIIGTILAPTVVRSMREPMLFFIKRTSALTAERG